MEFVTTMLGVVLVLEGIPWFLSPGGTKKILLQVLAVPAPTLRGAGLAAMLLGLVLVRFAQG